MTDDISRAITLVSYGNAFIKYNFDISHLILNSDAFSYNNQPKFNLKTDVKSDMQLFASDPISWLQKLKYNNCRELRFIVQPENLKFEDKIVEDFELVAFVGGGSRKFIHAFYNDHSEIWWESTSKKQSEYQTVWIKNYIGVVSTSLLPPGTKFDIDLTINDLHNILIKISTLAKRECRDFWSEWFIKADDMLSDSSSKINEYVKRIVPFELMNANSLRLLAGSKSAWCFGGMGSWNDLYFPDSEKEYNELTKDLYSILIQSYQAVANFI